MKTGITGLRSRAKPVVKVAKMLTKHLDGLLTYFQYPITNAVSEGLNSKIKGQREGSGTSATTALEFCSRAEG
ncbi:transposase [Luteolibacter sp. AS25]|uniref:transposase n=1 Tax=Luteolibacter sp. AS25 TaxID=3135776 RepID=UPI00398AA912